MDPQGSIWIVGRRDVQIIDANGEVLASWPLTRGPHSLHVVGSAVAFDGDALFVAGYSGVRGTTVLDVVAKSPSEPFGCEFLNRGGIKAVPDVQDVLLTIGGGGQRTVSLRTLRQGTVIPMMIEVNPDHDVAVPDNGYEVFGDLTSQISYLFSFMEPASASG